MWTDWDTAPWAQNPQDRWHQAVQSSPCTERLGGHLNTAYTTGSGSLVWSTQNCPLRPRRWERWRLHQGPC